MGILEKIADSGCVMRVARIVGRCNDDRSNPLAPGHQAAGQKRFNRRSGGEPADSETLAQLGFCRQARTDGIATVGNCTLQSFGNAKVNRLG